MPYKDKEKQKEAVRRNYQERKLYIQNLKTVPCADCKQSFPYYVMDFDHVNGEKIDTINRMRWSKGLKKIKAEIEKCDIVCSNCHRIRTYERNHPPLTQ